MRFSVWEMSFREGQAIRIMYIYIYMYISIILFIVSLAVFDLSNVSSSGEFVSRWRGHFVLVDSIFFWLAEFL